MKILIVKLSSMGDIVHTTPIIADILHTFPQAQIDWVCEESFVDLLRQVKGIRQIIAVAIRRWRHAPLSCQTWRQIRSFYHQLRAEQYDWIIDTQGLLKSAILSRFARGSVSGLANRTDGAGYEWPVRFFYHQRHYIQPRTHVITRSRLLVAKTLNIRLPAALDFGLHPKPLSLTRPTPYIVLVHASSNRNKSWPLTSWITLGQELITAGYHLILPWGSPEEQQTSQQLAVALGQPAYVPPRLSLSDVTSLLANATATIGVDTGLSHIAMALNKPSIQIYRFNTAWRTGSLGQDNTICLETSEHLVTPDEIKAALTQLGIL